MTLIPHLHEAPLAVGLDPITLHDRVCVPDGRVGRVVGFYRSDEPRVVVDLDVGTSDTFPAAELAKLAGRYTPGLAATA